MGCAAGVCKMCARMRFARVATWTHLPSRMRQTLLHLAQLTIESNPTRTQTPGAAQVGQQEGRVSFSEKEENGMSRHGVLLVGPTIWKTLWGRAVGRCCIAWADVVCIL